MVFVNISIHIVTLNKAPHIGQYTFVAASIFADNRLKMILRIILYAIFYFL